MKKAAPSKLKRSHSEMLRFLKELIRSSEENFCTREPDVEEHFQKAKRIVARANAAR